MAKPIEATPILKGEDIYNFIEAMETAEKLSEEERQQIKEDAEFMQSLMTFNF